MTQEALPRPTDRYDWSILPFALFHVVALAGVLLVEFSWWYVALCAGMYYLRMFGITAGYHRYFSHRAYKTSRWFQFVLALLGTISLQKGVLWWAAHHRDHHKYSDTEEDIHSPRRRGFWWSHMGWILCHTYDATKFERIRDFAKYPELRFLNRMHVPVATAFGALLLLAGGWGALMWGFFMSTVLLWHGTFTINSLAHVFGKKRYETGDDSKNSFVLAILTMGEGWHNNHHYYQSTANQGFFWWEIDMSYYVLKVLSWFGVVWDLRTPSQKVLRGELYGAQPREDSEPRAADPAGEPQLA